MTIFLNDRFVPEARAVVSVFDRGFLYGDSLFETMLVANGRPFRWASHLQRLQRGADFLRIKLPVRPDALRDVAGELIARNKMPDALLRLTLSRGVGIRGYSPKGAKHPTLVMALHPVPAKAAKGADAKWKLITSSFRLPANEPLAQFKTGNKLPQIMARAEADEAGADEALLTNTDGFIVEGASSNLFWTEGGTICTPPLASGILAGVTRSVVLEISHSLGLATRKTNVTARQLKKTGGVFVSLSSFGVVEARSLDGFKLPSSPLIGKIRNAYRELVQAETGLVPPVGK
jgi:aminodeoxychorismate lyase